MWYRYLPALIIVTGVALFLCHPTPFREPDYLRRRERILHPESDKPPGKWLCGDFNGDAEPDSAYVVVPSEGPDSGIVFLRFNHLIPSIILDAQFHNIVHLEKVNDIDGDGRPEIYFIAVKNGSCDATGFLYRFTRQEWREAAHIVQEGCRSFPDYDACVSVLSGRRYRISYRPHQSRYDEYIEGTIY